MDARSTTADSKHHYPPQLWVRSTSSPAVPRLSTTLGTPSTTLPTASLQPEPSRFPFPTHIDLLPILLPQQSSLYQAQLLQYNKLIAPGRGRGGGLQTPPLPPILSTSSVHVGTRSRSSSKVSNKDSSRTKPGTQNCHGNRSIQNNKGDCALITGKDSSSSSSSSSSKMVSSKGKQADLAHPLPSRPHNVSQTSATHSNSVPSTPHQHARKFSFESREPSPNANHGHSPRSAYSETNGNVPSLRPLPPRNGGCQYETIPERSRRRMPYSMGSDRLEKLDLSKIKSKLSEDDERKLTADMRDLYDRLKPTDAVEEKRHKLVQKLEKLLNDTWPGHDIRVHLFGSSGNLLCSDDADVDICITTPWKELEGVCMLADLLARHGMEKVVCVSSAKVPIVKIWDPELSLACDMNVNNTLALENTRMIRTYVETDERVRPLAMIIKYWTRRRIINDAAFGGTLSSYTWICMIIAFLQLRKPPVLPALHQQPHLKLGKREGDIAPFADDLDKLRGVGKKNKSTWGELLFQFFRFYAHEFDYSESVLSVRLGRLMRKTEKKQWHLAINNQLCVEEPFNTVRNLGNTADDTSFRGIHLELRRAFDLISEGKLEECCEQYVFPKEEERVWQKPASTSRPILLRSASQQHNRGGRGGGNRGGNRQQGQFRNNNHGSSRRASSSIAYDNNNNNNANQMYFPGYYMAPQDAGAVFMTPEMFQQLSQMQLQGQLQENQYRFLQYAQSTQSSAAYAQAALASQQRLQNPAQSQSSNARSRTNSFDNPPLTAPLNPEMYFWHQYQQGQPFFAQPGYTTYPSSPSSTTQAAETHRTSHRSTAASDSGATAASGSSLRSQSQPASRPLPVNQSGLPGAVSQSNGVGSIPVRHVNGIPVPSFMPDESNDTEQEPVTNHTPPAEERLYGQYLNTSSANRAAVANGVASGLLAFGDLGPQKSGQTQTRRRLSSDQFPVSILDRIKRTSRSPSPLGHNRAFSVGTNSAPISQAPFPSGTNRPVQDNKPLVVNGSVFKSSSANSSRQPSGSEGQAQGGLSFENPLHISQQPNGTMSQAETPSVTQTPSPVKQEPKVSEQPVVVNGSSGNAAQLSSQQGLPYANDAIPMHPNGVVNYSALSMVPGSAMPFSQIPFQRYVPRPHQNQIIAQLDLATENRMQQNHEWKHLSPVYETRTPSPTITRKFDLPPNNSRPRPSISGPSKDAKQEMKTKQKSPPDSSSPKAEPAPINPRTNGAARENGNTRAAKSDTDNASGGGWQKIPKGRKKGADGKGKNEVYPQSEQPPKNDSERKGG